MTKKKIIEILITALISAGIAFLTNLLGSLTSWYGIHADPTFAGVIGATIRSIRIFRV